MQERLRESRISNYEFCCCLVGVLMKVFSGSALIIDKQPNVGVYAKRHSQEENWTDHKLSRGAYSWVRVCKLVDSTAKHEPS